MKESDEAGLADTIRLMQDQLEDQAAQSDIDDLMVILQGRDRAVNRLQAAIDYCAAYEDDYEDEEETNGATGVITNPKTSDKQ
jgi:hypothetical protein